MNKELRTTLVDAIKANPVWSKVLSAIDYRSDGSGTLEYNSENVWVDPDAPFAGYSTEITDEELVRAHLLVQLASKYGYEPSPLTFEVERVYRPVGRPTGKGGRVDVLIRSEDETDAPADAFMFIECKAPDKFDDDLKFIEGQLFLLSMQESPRPRYLVYYTTELKAGELKDRLILIDTTAFPDFESWDQAGQPITDALPARYGRAAKKRYANVEQETDTLRPLDREATQDTFNRLRTEIHDVIWGGGGTNNNDVFVYITKLMLCKIFDEKETRPGDEYEFQRLGDAVKPEVSSFLVGRHERLVQEGRGCLPGASCAQRRSRVRHNEGLGRQACVCGRQARKFVSHREPS